MEVDRSYRALRRAQRAVRNGDAVGALEQFDVADSLRHGVEVDLWRGLGVAEMGKHNEAIGVFRSVIDEKSDSGRS